MPQMSPLNWSYNFLMFLLLIMITLILIHYNFMKINKIKNTSMTKFPKLNWIW
uniref:ATP synthase F0 subunit 8 n=1 Tax=Dendrocerus sp. ZJUH_2016009 TaxID=2491154 RepID=A0A3Q8U9X7_9HYME|nr:ATP synthase F0 subunit 8 [Dendrocerus sp. ZJUH_2016009]